MKCREQPFVNTSVLKYLEGLDLEKEELYRRIDQWSWMNIDILSDTHRNRIIVLSWYVHRPSVTTVL